MMKIDAREKETEKRKKKMRNDAFMYAHPPQ
jgi:hypothetical protein